MTAQLFRAPVRPGCRDWLSTPRGTSRSLSPTRRVPSFASNPDVLQGGSMRARLFQLDSFTTRRFRGNPAAVVLLDAFPSAAVMLAIAAENNLAETAFLVPDGADYRLRWFTPAVEVPLCGHATLASAAVVMQRLEPGRERVVFHSASGPLPVMRTTTGYRMDFPSRPSQRIDVPDALSAALGAVPAEVHLNAFNYLAVFDDEAIVRNLAPDMPRVAQLDRPGLIVTAAGQGDCDIVSRYFAPAKGVPEDPVTGGAHCSLAPYWAARLGKSELRAYQASARGGELVCRLAGERVELDGACVFYLEGEIEF
jgi:predicted PhzF superfamily epimerase YddE/YHI9